MKRRNRGGRYSHLTIQPAAPAPVTFDSLLERVKQGNAIELEIIQQFRAGLNSIAENMESECFNRSDALTDLRAMLEEERAKLDPTTAEERKELLSQAIQAEIKDCKAAGECNEERLKEAQARIQADFDREANYVVNVHNRDRARNVRITSFLDQMVKVIPNSGTAAAELAQMEKEAGENELEIAKAEEQAICNSRDKRLDEARLAHEDVRHEHQGRMKRLQQIAEIVDVVVYSD